MATGQFSVVPSDANIQEGRSHLPGDISVNNLPAIGSKATVTVAAGTTGIRHVATSATFSVTMTANVAATTVQIAVIDGASGGSTFLWRSQIVVAGTAGVNIATPSMQVYGSAATALTAEFSAGIGSATECVTLTYHDIGINTSDT